MTKLIAESDPEKCVNCIKWENQELILKKIKQELIKKRLNEVNKPEDVSTEDETIKCSVCKENFSPRVQKSYCMNNKLKNMDISANTYGSINPVVVINIVENNEANHKIDVNVENGGVINEAFDIEEDIPEFEEDIDPNNLDKETEDKEDVIYNASDKWRTSSKKSMSSVVSSASTNIKIPTRRRRSSAQPSNGSQKRRESIRNMLFGDPGLSGRRFSQDIRINEKDIPEEDETLKVIFLQVFVPFLIAGFGNVGAGIILDYVQYWDVFQTVTELFILVAS
jgi:solute carrier family 41